jgi:hypothetical protein
LLGLAGGLEIEHGAGCCATRWQISRNAAGARPFEVSKYGASRVVRDGANRAAGRAEAKSMQRQGCGFFSTRSHSNPPAQQDVARNESVLLLWRKLRFAMWNLPENSYILFIGDNPGAAAGGGLRRSNRTRKYQLTNDPVPELLWPS